MIVASFVLAIGGATALADKSTVKPTPKITRDGSQYGRVVAPDCTDNDGDLYGSGADCLGPDCNDNNADINPGETEKCNGVDDNCNGQIDEGFILVHGAPSMGSCNGGGNAGAECTVEGNQCPGGSCVYQAFADLPLGVGCINGRGICARVGTVVCKADGTGAVCNAVPGAPDPAGEGFDGNGQVDPTVPSCFDHKDNDCDGYVDHGGLDENNVRHNTNCTTSELCDGFDNDNDGVVDNGFALGTVCQVGIGSCVNSGVTICANDGTMICNVTPLGAGVEGPPGSPRCIDGKDNDCDGKIDLADPSCQAPEKCDGKDNDGDGVVDNGFPLGQSCSVGVGACQSSGVLVCSPDQLGIICNAVAKPPTPEQPVGGLCSDGIDNDCDGKTDAADPSCAVQSVVVNCALLRVGGEGEDDDHSCGSEGDDENESGDDDDSPCLRKRKVYFDTLRADPADVVTAEILAIDAAGALVQRVPVENGDTVRLDHRLDIPVASSTKPPSTEHTHAVFNNLRIGDTFTLVPALGKTKLPSNVYLQALRLPEALLVETKRLKLDCSAPIGPGAHFGSFDVVSLISYQPPSPGKTCKSGVRQITLRYTGAGSASGAAGVNVIVTTNEHLPRADHSVTAPAPILRVTLQTATTTTQAYCSAQPYLDVIQPAGSVVSGNTGTPIPVLAAIPNVDPSTLVVNLDGVDLLSALGIDPVRDLPGGPFSGQVQIGGETVEVEGLVVRSAPIDIPNGNVLSMNLLNLGCGGHVVTVEGQPVPVCQGRPSELWMRYDGGGCAASANTQCDKKFECSGNAGTNEPVRIVASDKNGAILLDTGSPASVRLRDTVRIVAADSGHQTLSCGTVVKIFGANGALLETVEFATSCSQPLTVGYVFGSLRVTGLKTVPSDHHDGEDDCDDDDDGHDGGNVAGVSANNAAGRHRTLRASVPLVKGGTTRHNVGGVADSTGDGGDDEGDDDGPPPVCYVDDLLDSGLAMVFRIEVTEPTSGQVTAGGPTRVTGNVCHGKPIAETDINGFNIDVSGQTLTAGNGTTSADTYSLDFDVMIPVTNLRQGIAAGNTTGSFDPGSNLLVARAMDGNFNTTFDSLTFAVGPIVPAPAFATAATAGGVASPGDPPNFVERAFVLGVNTTGITKVFTAQKDSNKRCMGDRAKRKLRDQRPPPKRMPVDGACDPDVSLTFNGAEIRKDQATNLELDFGITVDPNPNQIDVRIDLPPIDLAGHFGGYCESDCICAFGGCLCAVCVTVDVNANLVRKNMNLTFSVTEERILQSGVPKDQRAPLDMNFDIGESNPGDATIISGQVDIGCVLGFFLDVISFFANVFTLGFLDIDIGTFDFEITGEDMKDRFQALDGDPMDLDFVKVKNDEEALNDFDSKQRDSRLTGVEIDNGGFSIAVGSAFEPREDKIDPEARPIPGTPLKNAPVPQPPISDFLGRPASEVTIAISDDVFNQLFYNMTQTGKLKTEFTHVRELRDFMPDDCNTIADPSRRARCIGWKTQDCSAYPSGRTCSATSLNAGATCLADSTCHTCAAGSPKVGQTCIADVGCGQICSAGSAHPGQSCTLAAQCRGCSAGSTNAGAACSLDVQCGQICSAGSSNPGATCTLNVQCPGGTCINSGTCNTTGTCDAIAGSCDKDGTCDVEPLHRSCAIGKLLAKRFNVRPDTQMILKAKIDEAPKMLIDDDPQCPPGAGANDPCRTVPVELKLHVSNLTIAMVADRNNNSLVDGDEASLPECNFSELNSGNIVDLENEPPGTIATDCLLFKHCLKIDANFSMGVEQVNGKNRIRMHFGGIDRANTGGYQCGGSQSLPELDFFNQQSGRDSSLDQLEGNMRDQTPPLAPEGLDIGGNVRFEIDRILAIRSRPLATCVAGHCSGGFNNGGACSSNDDCEDGYQDFIGLTGGATGTPGPNPPCPN